MEAIHEPDDRYWIGEPIKVAEFKKYWVEELEKLKGSYDDEDIRTAFMKRTNVSEAMVMQLLEDCRPQNLCCGEESGDFAKLPEGVELATLRMLKEDLKKREHAPYRQKRKRMFRRSYSETAATCVQATSSDADLLPNERVDPGEVVLIVQVYKPMKMPEMLTKYTTQGYLNYKVHSEVAVLGSHTLLSLRSRIGCISDVAVLGEFSDDPESSSQAPAAEAVYKSGFFFIGDTFYNDMSDPTCIDYSEVIREWAKKSSRKVGPFKTARMEETKFEDLEIRLGYPYVYLHQGYCEHLIVFSDMRIIHANDSQRVSDYPVLVKTYPLGRRVRCELCRECTATWVTYENKRVTHDPFFFCGKCFTKYNYTADGKKIGNFRAEPFVDWSVV